MEIKDLKNFIKYRILNGDNFNFSLLVNFEYFSLEYNEEDKYILYCKLEGYEKIISAKHHTTFEKRVIKYLKGIGYYD